MQYKMEYEEIIGIIENKRRFGSQPGIEISKKLLAAVGNPQEGLRFIHIAGTNGKGSTAAFLRGILKQTGIRTGMFTSPHLISFTERIQVDGEQIRKEDAARLGAMLLTVEIDAVPTMFDYCLAIALLYFREQGCELVILETGLGGRLDATNVIAPPLAAVITRIGYDHMETLGSSLQEIAFEKAGIIKKGSTVISESQEQQVQDLLRGVCNEKEVPLMVIDQRELFPADEGFSFQGETYVLKMLGSYQWENAAAAILTAKVLSEGGYGITKEQIHKGIWQSFWPGRMELVIKQPFLMIDGAHNSHGVMALAKSLSSLYPGEKFHFIMGVLADKDYEAMVADILPLALDVVTVTPQSSRALQGEQLARVIRKKGVPAQNRDSIDQILTPFVKKQSEECPEGKTIALGSLYFIGDIRKILKLSL